MEKFDEHKVWTAVLFDADQQNFPYVKRFTLERCTQARPQSFLGDNANSRFVLLTYQVYPRLLVTYGGGDAFRDPMELDVEPFIGVKSYKAKGKRITTCTVDKIEELEPLRFPEPAEAEADAATGSDDDASDTTATSYTPDDATPSLFDELPD